MRATDFGDPHSQVPVRKRRVQFLSSSFIEKPSISKHPNNDLSSFVAIVVYILTSAFSMSPPEVENCTIQYESGGLEEIIILGIRTCMVL